MTTAEAQTRVPQISKIKEVFDIHKREGIDIRLVGSWARSAALRDELPTPEGDYGGYRDIDIVTFASNTTEETRTRLFKESQQLCLPITLEQHFASRIHYAPTSASIHYREFSYAVDPQIFAKNTVEFQGILVDTFDPQTLLYLTHLYGPMRPKDAEVLSRLMPQARAISALSTKLFEPFEQLSYERQNRYKNEETVASIRRAYHNAIPLSVRRTLSTITVPVWKRLTRLP